MTLPFHNTPLTAPGFLRRIPRRHTLTPSQRQWMTAQSRPGLVMNRYLPHPSPSQIPSQFPTRKTFAESAVAKLLLNSRSCIPGIALSSPNAKCSKCSGSIRYVHQEWYTRSPVRILMVVCYSGSRRRKSPSASCVNIHLSFPKVSLSNLQRC